MLGAEGPAGLRCSRAGCRQAAVWAIHWRNPRIHGAERVKTWLACAEHRGFLEGYLGARDFPLTVTDAGESVSRLPEADS